MSAATNVLLQQATGDSAGWPVAASAAIATTPGEGMVRRIARAELGEIRDVWKVVSTSRKEKSYFPQNADQFVENLPVRAGEKEVRALALTKTNKRGSTQ